MTHIFQIEVEEGRSMQETTDWLAMSASSILDELFPDQWREAMTLMALRINLEVADSSLEE